MSFLRKAEASLRAKLRKYPPLYALVGGVGIVLFWRGVWYGADYLYAFFAPASAAAGGISLGWPNIVDGGISFLAGSVLLLSTGLFVSELAGSETVLREEKKEEQVVMQEAKEVKEVEQKSSELLSVEAEIRHIEDELKEIHHDLHGADAAKER